MPGPLLVTVMSYRTTAMGMRFGLAMRLGFTGSDNTVEVLSIVSAGCGIATMKLPTPRSVTVFSTPSRPVTLIVQAPNETLQRIPLTRNLDDPVFGGGLPEVDASFTYRVEFAVLRA